MRFLNEQLYMELTQVGGAGDGGVDLRGYWSVPSGSEFTTRKESEIESGRRLDKIRKLRVLGQCKAERKALGPRAVRELEGVMAHQRGKFPHSHITGSSILESSLTCYYNTRTIRYTSYLTCIE